MIKTALIFAWLNSICGAQELEGYVVAGDVSNITEFPHSVYLEMKTPKSAWACGSSVLNQLILLTAAHCVYEVRRDGGAITAHYGNANKKLARAEFVQQFIVHPSFKATEAASDVAVLRVSTPMLLSNNVGRVAIFDAQLTPYEEVGVVAGWGFTDEENRVLPIKLRHVSQDITSRSKCEGIIHKHLAPGIICGGKRKASAFISQGDSGSALMVNGYIQVGVVSFKDVTVDTAIGMYSDVGYFYHWIMNNAVKLYCAYLDDKLKEKKDATLK